MPIGEHRPQEAKRKARYLAKEAARYLSICGPRPWRSVAEAIDKGKPGSDAWNPSAVARAIRARYPSAVRMAYRVGSGLYVNAVVEMANGVRRMAHFSF